MFQSKAEQLRPLDWRCKSINEAAAGRRAHYDHAASAVVPLCLSPSQRSAFADVSRENNPACKRALSSCLTDPTKLRLGPELL